MPSKIQLDENLWFLFICLQKSDYKSIDFTAVGNETNLKPPAARMRYTRLRRQIEDGRLIGTHGIPFIVAADKIAQSMRKKKVTKSIGSTKKNEQESDSGRKVKPDLHVTSNEYETAPSVSGSDSENDKPLARRRFQETCPAKPLSTSSDTIDGLTRDFSSVDVIFQCVVSDRRYILQPEIYPGQSSRRSNNDLNSLTCASEDNLRISEAGHQRRPELFESGNLDSFDIWDAPSTMPTLMGTSGYLAAQEVAGSNLDVSEENIFFPT